MLRVRSGVIGGWLLAAGLLGTALVGACADNKGALMLAISTDMKAPKDVNAVSITISTNGAIKHSFIGRVTPQGDVLLPATLAIVEPDDKGATIRIRVMAFQNQKPRVLRDVRTTAPSNGRTALLRIPLNFVNDGKLNGSPLPSGLVPDPRPGTEGLSPPSSTTSATGTPEAGAGNGADGGAGGGSGMGSGGASSSSGASGTSGAVPSGAGRVGTLDVTIPVEDFDFMGSFQPPCPNPQDDTIINGECHDNYIDPASLPDFDVAALGDSTGQTGACFPLAQCFGAAIDVGAGTDGTQPDGGTKAPPDGSVPTPQTDAGGSANPDAGAKPFKDYRPAAVTFDPVACTISLGGADPARFNVAIVTPDTGECVRAGECYVPIDHGATGWQADASGRIQLPSYLCTFLSSKGLHLATSTDVCPAKEESNPICTPKLGDDAGIFPVAPDGGTNAIPFAIPEDFASAVALDGPFLYFASQSRQGFVNLADPNAKPSPIANIATAGGAQLPWRFGAGTGNGTVALANGSQTGYVIMQGSATPYTFPLNIIDVAALDVRFTWASMQGQAMPSFYVAPPTPLLTSEVRVAGVTALAPTPFQNHVLYGDSSGAIGLVQPELMSLGQPSVTTGARVDGIALTDGSAGGAPGIVTGYALMGNGLYTLTADGSAGTTDTVPLVSDATSFAGITVGTNYFPRGLATAGQCLVFSSTAGLEYLIEKDRSVTERGVLVAAASSQPILGVTIGPDIGPGSGPASGIAAYYAVFAPKAPADGSNGGGIFSVPLPQQCFNFTPTPPDGGTGDAAPPPCSPATCPTGCCSLTMGCQPGVSDTACGMAGNACQDCMAIVSTCNAQTGTCN